MSIDAGVNLARREQGAAALWIVSSAIATFSVGFALADRIPAAVPVSAGPLLAFLLLGLNASALGLAQSAAAARGAETPTFAGWLCLLGPTLSGLAWSRTGSTGGALAVCAMALIGAAGWIAWLSLRPNVSPSALAATDGVAPFRRPAASPASLSDPQTDAAPEACEPPQTSMRDDADDSLAPDVAQRMLRRLSSVDETIESLLRIDFAAGEQQLAVHLPISPPLAGVPEVECEPLADADIDLRVGAAYPHGVRIDARRPAGDSAPRQVLIGVQLRASRRRRAA